MRAWLAVALSVGLGLSAVAGAQLPKPPRPFIIGGDTTPPNVFFSPGSGYTDTSSTSPNVTVTISFGDRCELPVPPGGPDSIKLNGQDVRSLFTYSGGGGGPACTGATAQAVGTIPLRVGTNADTLLASITNGGFKTGTGSVVYSYLPVYHAPPRHKLRIVVVAGATHGPPGSRVSVGWTVTNLGNTTDTINTKNHCLGAALSPPTNCFSSPDSIMGLAPGGQWSGTAFVDLGTTLGSTGRLETIAFERTHSTVTDTAYTDITVQNPLGPGVVLTTVNSGTTMPREKCLTIEIRPGVAYECGDLRVTHALPAVRTYNELRTPYLVYHSNIAHGHTAIGALITFDSTKGTPDTVTATVIDSATGATVGTGKWSGSWFKGRTQRVTVNVNEANTGGRWAYTFTATAKYDSLKTTQSYSATGAVISVSERNTSIGLIFKLAGVETLVPSALTVSTPWTASPPILWQNTEGDTRQYNPVPGDSLVWAAAGVDRPDTIKRVSSDGYYHRYAEHGAQVLFEGHGNEVEAIDRLGHIITVNAGGAGGTQVGLFTVPSPSVGLTYTYQRGVGATPIDTITAPPNGSTMRKVSFGYDASFLTDTITDPDGSFEVYHFTETTGGPDHLVTSYQDKRGTITRFHYDSAYKLIQVIVDSGPQIVVKPAVPSLNLTWTFKPAESRGLTTPVAPDSAYTLVTGPRGNASCSFPLPPCPDSLDQTRFWVDQWGEPTRIRDAHGYETEITRGNPTYPALVTYTRSSNGRVEVGTYDARGNDSTATDSSTVVNGVAATTTYLFDHVWDFDTLTTLPKGEQRHETLDPNTGNRLSQQSGSDPARRVTFAYGSYGVVTSVTQPLSPAATITYDHTLGNDSTAASPMGFTDSTYRDAIGRDTMEVTPNDAAQTQFTKAVHRYDIMDHVIEDITSAQQPAAESAYVHTHYTVDGLPDSVEKWSGPDPANILHIRTGTGYDAAGREILQVAQDGNIDTLYLDADGNIVTQATRRGFHITSVYDALNHLVRVLLPGVTYADTVAVSTYPRLPNCNTNQYCIQPDTATYAYDAAGNQIAALNGDAWVYRHYNPNGTLATDSLYTRTTAPLDSGGNFTSHIYGVTYSYDLDGQRISLGYPSQLLSTSGKSLSYAYDPSTGLLDSITDVFGNKYSYTFDAAQRVQVTRYPGTITDSVAYDADSRIVNRIEQAHYGSNPPPNAFTGPLLTERTSYDARDKITQIVAHEPAGDSANTTYSGLGHADSTIHGLAAFVIETWQTDAVGRQIAHVVQTPGALVQNFLQEVDQTYAFAYLAHTDRVTSSPNSMRKTFCNRNDTDCNALIASATSYDAAGNVSFQTTLGSSTNNFPNLPVYRARHFYDAFDHLRLVDQQGINIPTFADNPFEETRYDALGRRVWHRSRGFNGVTFNDGNAQGYLGDNFEQRYVWDGSQVLVEIRSRGSDSIPVSVLESDTPSDGQHTGVVAYVHSPQVDRPLAVQRFGYTPFAPFVETIHYSYHNNVLVAAFANGATALCTDSADTLCVGVGFSVPKYVYTRGGTQFFNPPVAQWNGELLIGQQNATGHLYKRNRYYDPVTGQFTQEDPAGLAGGLNAYGFANGDPVNYDDPFGLDSRDAAGYTIVLDGDFYDGGGDDCPKCKRLIAAQDAVMKNPAFQRNPQTNQTYCNQATCAVAKEMGVTRGLVDGQGNPLKADQIGKLLADAKNGYKEVSGDEAQRLANTNGDLVIVYGPGHVATVSPTNDVKAQDPGPGGHGPLIANVGASTGRMHVNYVFGKSAQSQVRYYVAPHP